MARTVKPLTNTVCRSTKPDTKDYPLFDGNGLILLVRTTGTKTWRYKYKSSSGIQVITLGTYPALTLAEARVKRGEFEALLAKGIDPKENIKRIKANNENSLENVTRDWLDGYAARKPLDESTKHKRLRKFENHLFPKFTNRAIDQIKLRDLKDALNTIYKHSPDNAQRIRADLIQIFSFAVQHGFIEANIARDLEDMDLSAKKSHRATLRSFDQIPLLIQRIKADTGHPLTKLCLLLTLHIFIRSSEIRFARWSEISFEKRIWTLPESREAVKGVKNSTRGAKMKAPHIIPLSNQAIELLKQVQEYSGNCDFVFPSRSKKSFISENTPNQALRRMGYSENELSLHGFRALARSPLGEMSLFAIDALEKQMSHMERNSTVEAYTHIAEYLEERKKIMQVWSDWLERIENEEYIKPYEYGEEIRAKKIQELNLMRMV